MMKQISITWILILAAFGLLAQEKIIKGKITDEYGAAIGAATIHLLNSNIWTSTSNGGIFQLKLKANGTYIFSISSIGYSTKTQEVDLNENGITVPDIQLSPIARQLDAVVVSAEKTEQLVQNIPISISSFSSRQVNEFRLWNIKELSTVVPALYAADPGDKRNVVSVRGITSTSYDPAVTTYVDGVNQFTLDMYIPQLFDVERIEVLRGPQGTLYGRNAMGGVINIITKQPTNNTNLFAEISAGNHAQQRYSVAMRTPIIRDKLFFGGSLLYDKRAGFYTNEYDNSSFDKQHSFAGNYYLKYLVAPTWTLTLNAKHVANRNSGPFPLVIGKDEALARPFILNQNAIGNLVDNIFNGSLSIDRSGEGIVFNSQTSYQANYRYYSTPIDGDFSPIDGVTIINDYGKKWNNVKAVTQEFKFASPIESASKLKWTTGLYLFYHHAPNKQATHFGNDATLLGSPDSNYSIVNTARIKNFGAAFYAQAVYSFNKKLDAIVGIRYDHQHSQQQVLGEYQPDAAPAPIFETQPDTSADISFGAWSPKVGLSVHLSKTNNAYISYARGYRTGGLTALSSDPSQPPLYPYQPEYSNSFEVGSKNTFLNNRVRLNVAVFYTIVSDAQVPTLVLPQAITVTRNAGGLKSRGVELESTVIPIKGLEAVYNFGFTDAKYSNGKLSQSGSTIDLEGHKQIFTPDLTSMLAVQYSIVLKASSTATSHSGLRLIARAEWSYTGTTYFDLANNIQQAPYHLFNTRIGLEWKYASLYVWGRNLTDTRYISYAYDFGAVHLGNPKLFGFTLLLSK